MTKTKALKTYNGKNRCQGDRFAQSGRIAGWGSYHQCDKEGKFQTDGSFFCGTHDPSRIKARQEAKENKETTERNYEREQDAKNNEKKKQVIAFLEKNNANVDLIAWADRYLSRGIYTRGR